MNDTIAAIATPVGTAGISVIRLSGPDAWNITQNIFRKPNSNKKITGFKHSKFYYGWITDPSTNNIIDEGIVLAFQAPKSYTTEDLIEIQCHGGINVTQKILQVCLEQGARVAEKGEFTKRAFLGGRIDLTQVEAVLDIISAKTELFSSVAAYNLSGKLSELINDIRNKLMKLISHIEASVDFPDEVDEMPYEEVETQLTDILNTIKTVIKRASDGNILKHGIKVAIIGKPNVGKSSLFNHLLKSDRAIVTNIPGTTRDILQEYIDIDGIPVILIDTAGIRETLSESDSDYIESIGVDRSKGAINDSDLILFIYDINQGMQKEDSDIYKEALKYKKPILQLANKSDIENTTNCIKDNVIKVSALRGNGIEEVKDKIKGIVLGDTFQVQRDEVYINMRHKECLTKAEKHINLAYKAVTYKEMQDLISIDIKAALLALDEIVGEVVAEEIIDHIFSQFCVGK